MSTKYSTSGNPRWTWVHQKGNPHLTSHLQERYDERTPRWACSPETAWEDGVDVSDLAPYLEDQGGQTPEEVRYYAESNLSGTDWHGVVFIVTDGSIVTCYTHQSLAKLQFGRAVQEFLVTLAAEEGYV